MHRSNRGKSSHGGRGRGPAKRPSRGPVGNPKRPRRSTSRVNTARVVKVTPLPAEVAEDGKVRLNRFLASAGICSRRKADEIIVSGRVSINGDIVRELGIRVDPEVDDVRCDGNRIAREKSTYVLFNKPKGVVCTNARNEQRQRAIDFLEGVKGRTFTIGRLDAESEGLILLTNDGDFANTMAHPKFGITKTYSIVVRGRVTPEIVEKARGGVWLSDGRTSGARIMIDRLTRDKSFMKVVLREGRNREIRRVFAKLGFPVMSLKRIRIGHLNLHGLARGRYRFLSKEEVQDLLSLAMREGD